MRLFLTCILLFNTFLMAAESSSSESERKKRVEKQLKIEMEKEKKYSKEQTFYQSHNYDFKGAEVNPNSVESVPDIEIQDDFDMDSVYD